MVCCDVEEHGCLGFHMGGINISARIKQPFYPRTRHGELKVISMIYAPPYLIRRSVPKVKKVKSIVHELATSPTINPRAHKTITLERRQPCTTITTEHHKIEKATQHNALRHRTYRRE